MVYTQGQPVSGRSHAFMQTPFAALIPEEARRPVEPLLAADSV
jgi:hypothetical protein